MATPSFTRVNVRKPSANTFDLTHDKKFSANMGQLTPIMVQEVLPGDSFKIRPTTLIRFAPMLAPVMHKVRVYTHYFFVPNRLVWPDWEKFISPDLAKDTPPAWPHIDFEVNTTGADKYLAVGGLGDYLGLPAFGQNNISGYQSMPAFSAIPFQAYQLIWQEYYRAQDLQPPLTFPTLPSGHISVTGLRNQLHVLRKPAWRHDYFTSALPFAQKGPAVTLPFLGDAEVKFSGLVGQTGINWNATTVPGGTGTQVNVPHEDSPDVVTGLYADLDGASATTINDLRVALRLQEFFEKAARGGTRYIEQIRMHFGVRSSDARLQRPEFLGGSIQNVIISEVLQTAATEEFTTPLATMGGHGLSAAKGDTIRYYAEEHGYIFGLQFVLPDTAYFQGLPRHFSRESWQDYAWPTFAHLGEQAILNKELYVPTTGGNDPWTEEVFGYIPRYSEYRHGISSVHGTFKTSLKFWHMGREFATKPALNETFIVADPTRRIFAAGVDGVAAETLWCYVENKLFVNRKLPKYGTPTL